MPSQAFIFGVDADGDGRVDLFTAVDALHSIANYLKKNGWKCRMNRAQRQKVILSYNHSLIYANTVLAVAEKIRPKIPVRVAVAAPK
jgi:membrane-bound lytic murein transglycosylase B